MKALAEQDEAAEGMWLRAEQQVGGVGRLGRKWESPAGNLYCSTVVDIRPGDPSPSTLSFVTALAVHDMLKDQLSTETPILLKWPNDVLVKDAKICGILLERVKDKVVVGIGINVTTAPNVADRPTTSMHLADGHFGKDAEKVLDILIPAFGKRLKQWRQSGLPSILQDWLRAAHEAGSNLLVSGHDGEKIVGEYQGLNEDGALRLRKADGTLIVLHAGDVELDQRDAG